jgi:hypothetical protein
MLKRVAHYRWILPITLFLTASVWRPGSAASVLESLGLKRTGTDTNSSALAALSQDQVVTGLKEALAKGVQHAITNLGKPDGFLKDAAVKISMPQSLTKIEKGLRAVGQGNLADEFVTTMNRAAEQAVPEAASILGDSLKQMTITDAKQLLTGTNGAATDYFRRTSSTNLHEKFLPIVKGATEQTGVTASYKKMVGATSGKLGSLGSLGSLTQQYAGNLDVDAYVTDKAVEGLFKKIAEQEKLIRENPAARTSQLLQQVFGAVPRVSR